MNVGDLVKLTSSSHQYSERGMLGIIIDKCVPQPHQREFLYVLKEDGQQGRWWTDECKKIN